MKFSDFYYIGLIDRNFNLLYCDSPAIFKRMNASHIKLQKKMNKARATETLYGMFTMDSVRHKVIVEQTIDDFYLVKIVPQIPDEIIDNKFLFENVDQIKNESFDVYTHFQMILNFLDQCKYDEIRKYAQRGLGYSSNIAVDCINLRNRFDNDQYITYVELRRKLIRTGDIINFAITDFGKRIYFTYDIQTPYVYLDYKQLEFAIYNLSKLAMVLTCDGSESYIEISSVCDEFIDLYAKIPLQQNQPFVKFKNEFCAVKHAFKKLGGHLNLYEEEGFLRGSGYFDAEFSKNHYIVPKGTRMVLRRSIQNMLTRTKTSFYPVFDYDEKNSYTFRKHITHMPEELDWELRYAQTFFEGIDILKQD